VHGVATSVRRAAQKDAEPGRVKDAVLAGSSGHVRDLERQSCGSGFANCEGSVENRLFPEERRVGEACPFRIIIV
jgi:hypothetical protein